MRKPLPFPPFFLLSTSRTLAVSYGHLKFHLQPTSDSSPSLCEAGKSLAAIAQVRNTRKRRYDENIHHISNLFFSPTEMTTRKETSK